jgi:MFS family permease
MVRPRIRWHTALMSSAHAEAEDTGSDDASAAGPGSPPPAAAAASQPTSIEAAVTAPGDSWAPMRNRVFRSLWFAQLGSNIGTWMQTVGAQWLLVDRAHAATLVALVQTASLLPVMLLSLPAGVLADVLDRRRLLIGSQAAMAVIAGVLAALTAAGLTTPATLLALTFVLGCGQAVTGPAWQAIQPELVERRQIPAAATLGSLTVNLARAVGPAAAGLIVAATGPTAVFTINAVSFVGVVAALAVWRRKPAEPSRQQAEAALAALAAGTRYVRNAPAVTRILLRSALFVVPGSALWALLPVVSADRMHLGAGGYGALLGALGLGAVGGALTLSRLRAHLSANQILAGSAILFGLATLVLALPQGRDGLGAAGTPLVAVFMVVGGFAWIASLSILNAALQLTLPAWVRARGLSMYLLIFMGGQALGSLAWGLLAGAIGDAWTLAAAAALLGLAGASVAVRPLRPTTGRLDRTVSAHWPDPALVFEPDPDDGPVLVVRRYRVPPENQAAFLDAMRFVGHSRRRTGATRWDVYRDGDSADGFTEVFSVRSWGEHLRQHADRLTGADRESERRVEELTVGDLDVEHLFPPHVYAAVAADGSGSSIAMDLTEPPD